MHLTLFDLHHTGADYFIESSWHSEAKKCWSWLMNAELCSRSYQMEAWTGKKKQKTLLPLLTNSFLILWISLRKSASLGHRSPYKTQYETLVWMLGVARQDIYVCMCICMHSVHPVGWPHVWGVLGHTAQQQRGVLSHHVKFIVHKVEFGGQRQKSGNAHWTGNDGGGQQRSRRNL